MLSLLLVDPLNLDYRNGKEGEEIKGKRTWVETEKLREEKAVCSVDTLLPNKSYFQNGKRSEEFVGPVLLKIGGGGHVRLRRVRARSVEEKAGLCGWVPKSPQLRAPGRASRHSEDAAAAGKAPLDHVGTARGLSPRE